MHIIPINISSENSFVDTGFKREKNTPESIIPFKDVFSHAYNDLVKTQEVAKSDAYNLSMGKTDDLHNIMINSQKAETVLNMTVQLTSRAVSAYNEIMRMQV